MVTSTSKPNRFESAILQGPEGHFTEAELNGLPEPVKQYFRVAIAPGTPLARTAQIRMRGSIKLQRWMPFRARQILNPHTGYVWSARVAWLISGADYHADGQGGMDWKLLGLKQLVHAEGPDVSRAAAARGAAEAVWVPTAVLPRYGVEWTADDDHHIRATWMIDGQPFSTMYNLGNDHRIRRTVFDRWGDPDETGTWSIHPFGGEVTSHATFDGLTIPSAGRMGWFYGTERWDEGEFFRFQITDLKLIPNGLT
jgi:hypothetical protein